MMPITGDAIRSSDSLLGREKANRDAEAVRLQKARTLDRRTLGGIYDDYHEQLYSYIFRRVGDVETARDLTADVFRRFLQATAKGNGPEENLRAWLYRVAHNIVIDHYRRQQHQPSQTLNEDWAGDDVDPRTAAEERLQVDRVRDAMRHLTAEQQQVISLKFLEGLSNEEVADITQKSIGAVKGLQHRALSALRRQLTSLEEEVPL